MFSSSPLTGGSEFVSTSASGNANSSPPFAASAPGFIGVASALDAVGSVGANRPEMNFDAPLLRSALKGWPSETQEIAAATTSRTMPATTLATSSRVDVSIQTSGGGGVNFNSSVELTGLGATSVMATISHTTPATTLVVPSLRNVSLQISGGGGAVFNPSIASATLAAFSFALSSMVHRAASTHASTTLRANPTTYAVRMRTHSASASSSSISIRSCTRISAHSVALRLARSRRFRSYITPAFTSLDR